MSQYQRKDAYYLKAKAQGLPSRASFKIEEIIERFPLLKKGDWVLDLGAAPGGWTVMLSKKLGPSGKVLALDLAPLSQKGPNVEFFQGNLEDPAAQDWLAGRLGARQVQAVFSDMSPKLSGVFFRDAYLSYELCRLALKIAQNYLAKGGHLVTKIFPGEEFAAYLKELKSLFNRVKSFEPKATRKTSREVYVLAMDYQGAPQH